MNEWIAAAVAVSAGLVLGAFFARLTQNILSRPKRAEVLRSTARPLSSAVFSVFLIAGLVTALGFVNEEALDQIPHDLVDYIPSLLSAAIVMIGANVLGQLTETALERTVARLPGSAARNLPTVARIAILAFGAILAAAQLGVDTTIINITVAALLFSIGLGAAMMIGLGSRNVAGEVAAGRAVRRILEPGDHVDTGTVAGEVIEIATVAVEVGAGDESILIPHSQLLGHTFRVRRSVDDD